VGKVAVTPTPRLVARATLPTMPMLLSAAQEAAAVKAETAARVLLMMLMREQLKTE
jgi:hypothetical protein